MTNTVINLILKTVDLNVDIKVYQQVNPNPEPESPAKKIHSTAFRNKIKKEKRQNGYPGSMLYVYCHYAVIC